MLNTNGQPHHAWAGSMRMPQHMLVTALAFPHITHSTVAGKGQAQALGNRATIEQLLG